MTVAASGAGPTIGGWPLPMVKLADRELLRDRLSRIATLLGIVLAIVLVVPFRRIAAPGVVPVGANSFDNPLHLPGHKKHAILSPPDVAGMEERAVGFVPRRKLGGGTVGALFAGSDARNNRSLSRDIIAGSITELSSADAVAVHSTYLTELGILQRGVNDMQLIRLARRQALDGHADQFRAFAARLTVGVCAFAPISTIKMTCVDPVVVLAGRGRQGHGTNPGS
jgi:hypothetical protein